jgi:RNA polymerase sigma-70 factor, ECF subfamily
MSYFQEVDPGPSFEALQRLREGFGVLPNLYRAQTLLPRLIEAETRLVEVVLLRAGVLTRLQKESILLGVSAARGNVYCATLHGRALGTLGMTEEAIERLTGTDPAAGLPSGEAALLELARGLIIRSASPRLSDIEALHAGGFEDTAILEAVLVTALGEFLCVLSIGLGVEPDFAPRSVKPPRRPGSQEKAPGGEEVGPWLRGAGTTVEALPPFAFFRDRFGFVPGLYRAQTLLPEVVGAEAHLLDTVLVREDVLARERKERLLVAVSSASRNAYCVAVHSELLRNLGADEESVDRIAIDYRSAGLAPEDRALLEFALTLTNDADGFSRQDIDALRREGLGETQVLEAVVATALTRFLNTLQAGLGTVPDFALRRAVAEEMMNRKHPAATLTKKEGTIRAPAGEDEDDPWVQRVRAGDTQAFEILLRRHHRRIYRTLMGITLNHADAEDGAQNTFLKAFQHIGEFEGTSRFTTWLTRIAINEGVQRLRRRRETESLDTVGGAGSEDEGEFRPGDLRDWADDPEEQYSQAERRALVEKELRRLPAKYRLTILLRDIERLSTSDAAAAMDLGEATFKTRLSRARLMLRDALAPHFVRRDGRVTNA